MKKKKVKNQQRRKNKFKKKQQITKNVWLVFHFSHFSLVYLQYNQQI